MECARPDVLGTHTHTHTSDARSAGPSPDARVQGAPARAGCRAALLVAVLAGVPRWVAALDLKREEIRGAWGRPAAALVEEERGRDFAKALDRAKALIPERSRYLLLGNASGPGAAMTIALRLELLPRTAVLFSRLVELGAEYPGVPPAVVSIDGDERPPRVLPGFDGPARFAATLAGTPDDGLPASVDEVTFDGTGGVSIRGWCQAEGVDCGVAAVLLDGHPVPFVDLGREPRGDVAAALPKLGPCTRAGYRVRVPRIRDDGRLDVEVVFRAADGRFRCYPKVSVEVPR